MVKMVVVFFRTYFYFLSKNFLHRVDVLLDTEKEYLQHL